MSLPHTRLALCSLLLSLPTLAPAQVFVDAGAAGAGDGSSWSNAYTDLHSALLNHPGEEIWVAAGVYVPTATDPQGDRRVASFSLPPGTALYGGFAGGETQREQRNPALNPTVLSGDLDGDDSVDARGATLSPDDVVGDNAYQVVRFDAIGRGVSIGPDTVLDGFVLSAGRADGDILEFQSGGGAVCLPGFSGEACSPTLANLEFRGNAALGGGGAFAMVDGSAAGNPVFQRVLFAHNHALVNEGGGGLGGAVHIGTVSAGVRFAPQFEDVRFEHNRGVRGGALFLRENVDARIDRARFVANRAAASNGIDPFFVRGGAIALDGGFAEQARLRVFNAVFVDNVSDNGGGVLSNEAVGGEAELELVNVSASRNTARVGGVLFQAGPSTVVTRLRNAILWANSATQAPDAEFDLYPQGGGSAVYAEDYGFGASDGHRLEFARTLVQGSLGAPAIVYNQGLEFAPGQAVPPGLIANQGGNLGSDPRFATPALHLHPDSPAIDAGSAAFNPTLLDVEGQARVLGAAIDLGAYEFLDTGCRPGLTEVVYCDGFE